MNLEETRIVAEVGSVRELNLYLQKGWKLIQTFVRLANDSQSPRFVVAWQSEGEPDRPEILDEWELSEMDRQRFR